MQNYTKETDKAVETGRKKVGVRSIVRSIEVEIRGLRTRLSRALQRQIRAFKLSLRGPVKHWYSHHRNWRNLCHRYRWQYRTPHKPKMKTLQPQVQEPRRVQDESGGAQDNPHQCRVRGHTHYPGITPSLAAEMSPGRVQDDPDTQQFSGMVENLVTTPPGIISQEPSRFGSVSAIAAHPTPSPYRYPYQAAPGGIPFLCFHPCLYPNPLQCSARC